MTIAQLKRQAFRTSRLLDFASERELVLQIGYRSDDWPAVVVKELIDNGLDGCEDSGIPPVITVKVDEASIEVTDNGPGIQVSTIDGVLDLSSRTSSRRFYVSPSRGQQGNFLQCLLMMPFALDSAHPGRIDIASCGTRHEITVAVDEIRQRPSMTREEHPEGLVKTGTSVRIHWPQIAGSKFLGSKSRILQIVEAFAWLNPHASFCVDCLGESTSWPATNPAWWKWLTKDPTSIHWYGIEEFSRLISAHIAHEEDGGEGKTVRAFIAEFDGLSSTTKGKAILESTGLARMQIRDLMEGEKLKADLIKKLLAVMKESAKPVRAKAFGFIGKDHFKARCKAIGAEMGSFQYRKTEGKTKGGLPWVMEVAFCWLGEGMGDRKIILGTNWSAALGNPFKELGVGGDSLDALLEKLHGGREEPILYVLHAACPRIQHTDRGKSGIVVEGDPLDAGRS